MDSPKTGSRLSYSRKGGVMNLLRQLSYAVVCLTSTLIGVSPVLAQIVTTGAPGSPDATTTIDGRYIPPPPQSFKGEINLNAVDSKPAWPARVVPPKGAPNIVLILTDDVGFG